MRTGESAEGGVPSAPPLVMQLKIPTRISNYYWTTIEESRLQNWFNASGLHEYHNREKDFSEIATEIGRTNRACRDKLMIIFCCRGTNQRCYKFFDKQISKLQIQSRGSS
jgi:hypothetical protein